ncbi:unnamed protein product, partial [Effrenium voratum]
MVDKQRRCRQQLARAAEARNWQQALAVLQSMRAQHLEPKELCHSFALEALQQASRWIRALWMLSSMRQWCGQRGRGLGPSFLMSGVKACEKGSQWALALALLLEAERSGRPLGAQGTQFLLRCCARASAWQRALNLAASANVAGRAHTVDSCNRAGQAFRAPLRSFGVSSARPLDESARVIGLFFDFALVPPSTTPLTCAVLRLLLPLRRRPPRLASWRASALEDVFKFGPAMARTWLDAVALRGR